MIKKLLCKLLGHRMHSNMHQGIIIKKCMRCGYNERLHWIPRIIKNSRGGYRWV